MPIVKGTYFNGVRDVATLRARCWVDKASGCWRYLGGCCEDVPPTLYVYLPNGERAIRKGRRVAVLAKTGRDIPAGMVAYASEKCEHANCLNPDHALVGTRREACAAASKRGAYNTQAHRLAVHRLNQSRRKITLAQQLELRDAPGPYKELAERYGISTHRVKAIKQGVNMRASSVFEWRG